MRYNMRVKKLIFRSFLAFLFFSLSFGIVLAGAEENTCVGVTDGTGVTLAEYQSGMTHTIKMDLSSYDPGPSYYVKIQSTKVGGDNAQSTRFKIDVNDEETNFWDGTSWKMENGILTLTIDKKVALTSKMTSTEKDAHYVVLYRGANQQVCRIGEYYTTKNHVMSCGKMYIWQDRGDKQCNSSGCMQKDTVHIRMEEIMNDSGELYNGAGWYILGAEKGDIVRNQAEPIRNGSMEITFTPDTVATHYISLKLKRVGINYDFPCDELSFDISDNCQGSCNEGITPINLDGTIETVPFELCAQIAPSNPAYARCVECANQDGIRTAVGCIPAKPESIIRTTIKIGLSIAGGTALLMIFTASFSLSTSMGDPKKTNDAKDMLSSAIIGLLFIIFSVTMLQFIGVKLFQIPGFGV